MDQFDQEQLDRLALFAPEIRAVIERDIIRMQARRGRQPPLARREPIQQVPVQEPIIAQASASFGGFLKEELKEMEAESLRKRQLAEKAKQARDERSKLHEKRASEDVPREDSDLQNRRAKEPRLSAPSSSTSPWQPTTSRTSDSEMSSSRFAEVMGRAAANARSEKRFERGGFTFEAMKGHILESSCKHPGNVEDATCLKCKYSRELALEELPEMVFPRNRLTIYFSGTQSFFEFNTLDALKMVCADRLPDVKVAPSTVWQSARSERIQQITEQHKPFDWTFTTHYKGSTHGCTVTETTDRIDMERLKRRDEIVFNSSITLFEDELADHGIAQLSVRIRVMETGYFFVLLRFYMRVDNVLIRVCDTRIVGNNGEKRVHREWQLRESKYETLCHVIPEELLNPDTAWQHLPIKEEKIDYISAE